MVVVNSASADSRQIAEYYVRARKIPTGNVCRINTTAEETIERPKYDKEIAEPIKLCLKQKNLVEQVLYLVTTLGVPLRVAGAVGTPSAEGASVDSELTLLYGALKGAVIPPPKGYLPNPFFKQRDTPFTHPRFSLYMVTRLAAYDVAEVKAMIDRGLKARNVGKFVIDMPDTEDRDGNNWLRDAFIMLPSDRVEAPLCISA